MNFFNPTIFQKSKTFLESAFLKTKNKKEEGSNKENKTKIKKMEVPTHALVPTVSDYVF
jgi:hypothetical protein